MRLRETSPIRHRLSVTSDLISKIHEEKVFTNILKVVRDKQVDVEPRTVSLEILDMLLIIFVSSFLDLLVPSNFFDIKLVLSYAAYKNVGLALLLFTLFYKSWRKNASTQKFRYLSFGMPSLSIAQSSYLFERITKLEPINESFHSFNLINNYVQFCVLINLFLITRKCQFQEIKTLIIIGTFKEVLLLLLSYLYNKSFSLSQIFFLFGMQASLSTLIYLHFSERNRIQEKDRKEASAVEKKAMEFDEKVKTIKEEIEKKQTTNLVQSFTSSKADNLLMKLKFLKLNLLIEENKKEKGKDEPLPLLNIGPKFSFNEESLAENSRKSNFSRRKGPTPMTTIINNPITPISELVEISPKSLSKADGILRNEDKKIKLRYCKSPDKIRQNKLPEPNPIKEEDNNIWKLNAKDIDKILDSIINQGKNIWMPEFLNQKKESKYLSRGSSIYTITSEAKDFLMNHFAEKDEHFNQPFESSTPQRKLNHSPTSNSTFIFNLGSWNFDVFELNESSSGNVLIEFGNAIFNRNGISRNLGLDSTTYFNFLSQIQSGYNKKPYHNAMHAVDVTNSVIFFLENGLGPLPELEETCLLISSLTHDLGHPGLNNSYLVSSRSKEALIYNDQSVLENFHVATAFQIMNKEQNNILKNLSSEHWVAFRKLCIFLILETDLQKHFLIVNKFKNMLTLGSISMEEDSSSRHMVISVALKCGDIGHGSKALDLHKKWSRRILEEFYRQGDQETLNGLPISPLCDRNNNNICKSQEGFLKALVLPLFETWNEFLKNEQVKESCIAQITSNIQFWKEESKKEEEGKGSFLKDTSEVLDEMKKDEEHEQPVFLTKQEYMNRNGKKASSPLLKLNSLKF